MEWSIMMRDYNVDNVVGLDIRYSNIEEVEN